MIENESNDAANEVGEKAPVTPDYSDTQPSEGAAVGALNGSELGTASEPVKVPAHDVNEKLVCTVFKCTDSPAVVLSYATGERHTFQDVAEACKGIAAACE